MLAQCAALASMVTPVATTAAVALMHFAIPFPVLVRMAVSVACMVVSAAKRSHWKLYLTEQLHLREVHTLSWLKFSI